MEISVPRKVKCFLVQLICHRYKSFSNINQTLISSKEGNLGLNLRGGRGYQSMMLMLRGLRVEFRRIMGPSLRDTAFGRGASSRNLVFTLQLSTVLNTNIEENLWTRLCTFAGVCAWVTLPFFVPECSSMSEYFFYTCKGRNTSPVNSTSLSSANDRLHACICISCISTYSRYRLVRGTWD